MQINNKNTLKQEKLNSFANGHENLKKKRRQVFNNWNS